MRGPLLALLALVLLAGCDSGVTEPTPTPSAEASDSSVPTPSGQPSGGQTSRPDGAPGARGGPVPAGFTPVSVSFASPEVVWVLGDAPCDSPPCTSLARTRDGGGHWVGIPAPRVSLAKQGRSPTMVRHVVVADPGEAGEAVDGWVFGGDLWVTHDGARSWQEVTLGDAGVVLDLATNGQAVYALTAGSCGARGCRDLTLWRAPVGRDDWRAVSDGPGAEEEGSVAAASLVVAGDGVYVLAGGPWALREGSLTPLDRPCAGLSGAPFRPVALAASAPTDLVLICVGDAATGSAGKRAFTSADGGRHWTPVGSPPRTGIRVTGLAATTGGTFLAVAPGGLFVTRDAGESWPRVSVAGHEPSVERAREVWFVDADHGALLVALGLDEAALYVTDDGGRHWRAARIA